VCWAVHDLIVAEMVARQAKRLLMGRLLRDQVSAAPPSSSQLSAAAAAGKAQGGGSTKVAVECWQQEREEARRRAVEQHFELLLGDSAEAEEYHLRVTSMAIGVLG
jgi:hypothetical protein